MAYIKNKKGPIGYKKLGPYSLLFLFQMRKSLQKNIKMSIYEFARNIGASLGSKGDFPNRRPRTGFTPHGPSFKLGDSCTPEKNLTHFAKSFI